MTLHPISTGEGPGWQSYTPVLTGSVSDPTLGSGSSVAGFWMRLGQLGIVFARINFGTSGVAVGSGNYRISLPFLVHASQPTIQGGLGTFEDTSAGDEYALTCYGVAGQTYGQMYLANTTLAGLLGAATPVIPAISDIIAATFIVMIA